MTHLDPTLDDDQPPKDFDPHATAEAPEDRSAHTFDVVDLSRPSEVSDEGEKADYVDTATKGEPGLDPNMAILEEERRKGEQSMNARLYDQGDYDSWFFEGAQVLITICVLAIVTCFTLFLWHAVDAQTRTNLQKQRTQQQFSRERANVAAACQRDDVPRLCIQDSIPPGQ